MAIIETWEGEQKCFFDDQEIVEHKVFQMPGYIDTILIPLCNVCAKKNLAELTIKLAEFYSLKRRDA